MGHSFNQSYDGSNLDYVAFPMGGMGAGMICVEGNGALSQVSLRHTPELRNEPILFAALHIEGSQPTRVLQGPIPMWKATHTPQAHNGCFNTIYGLPRFESAKFTARFPFGLIELRDRTSPIEADVTAWSPFEPLHADDSSLPVAALEYRLRNVTAHRVKGVFSFHSENFVKTDEFSLCCSPRVIKDGFVFESQRNRTTSFVCNWQISSLQPKVESICRAPLRCLSDHVGWRSISADGFVDTRSIAGDADGTIYLAQRCSVRQRSMWEFLLGHDGGIKVWIDGQQHACVTELVNPATPDRSKFSIELDAGEHEVVIALDTARGLGQGIFLRLGLPSGVSEDSAVPPEFGGVPVSLQRHRAALSVVALEPGVQVDAAWFRGGWFDPLTMLWKQTSAGFCGAKNPPTDGPPSPGASLYLPIDLEPGQEKLVRILLAWHYPTSMLRFGPDMSHEEIVGDSPRYYEPLYSRRFSDIDAVTNYWRENYDHLRQGSQRFSECLYGSTVPAEVIEAVASNLTILKSPTVMRQHDGRFWAWEGTGPTAGSCAGSCTHVWNYAQALPHLFPDLERSLRETEHLVSQNERGHQSFRSSLPIRPTRHDWVPAADGQLGGILKTYREWRISADMEWLRRLWPKVRRNLEFCIESWDPAHTGALTEPHHNTYDIEFWGGNSFTATFYVAALRAAIEMGRACGDSDLRLFEMLLPQSKKYLETELWNGEYFQQRLNWTGATPHAVAHYRHAKSPDCAEQFDKEGPKYQILSGCLSDGVLGLWLAECCGVDHGIDPARIGSHLDSVFKHNFKTTLAHHTNPQRPGYALGNEAGLLMCTWPRGGKPSLPMVYSDEVWTGVEYQVASHLITLGRVREGLTIVRAARSRYDGTTRNPFAEVECGLWYARAMSSYALLGALTGIRYDGLTQTLHIKPRISGDFRCFLSTSQGYGMAGVRAGEPFVEVAFGRIPVTRIEFSMAAEGATAAPAKPH